MTDVNMKENKMGVMPVTRLLISMSLPMMFSMFVQALYNIVDSVFVSRISEEALTAVSLGFPFQTLMISFATGTCVGINALLSMRLGQKDQQAVNATALNGIFLAVCNYAVFFIIALVSIEPYLASQTSNPVIIQYGKEYLSVVMFAGFGLFLGVTFDRLLQSTGKTFHTMITQLIGAITNIIFDPVLIFGLGPFPQMGIMGAAVATVAGQILGAIVSVVFNLKFNNEIQFSFKKFRPNSFIIVQIYKVGLPSIILQAVGSFTTYGMNLVFKTFREISDTIIAFYGAYFKLQSLIFMPVFGLNNGVIPIVAYNYGARNKHRMLHAIKLSATFACGVMIIGMLIFLSVPGLLLSLFDASAQMLSIGEPALRIISTSFAFAGVCIAMGSVFQALGRGTYSMIVSFVRQLVVLVPCAYLLARWGLSIGNNDLVWLSYPIAEVFSLAVTLILFTRLYRKVIAPMEDSGAAVHG